MTPRGAWRCVLAAALLVLAAGGPVRAARVRFHYAPADACGTMVLKPGGPGGVGEQTSWFGFVREPAPCPPRANQVLTFRHPCTGGAVHVPVRLPEGTPNVEYRASTVVYNYGSYTVEVHFLADGSVDVVYNSGLFRAP